MASTTKTLNRPAPRRAVAYVLALCAASCGRDERLRTDEPRASGGASGSGAVAAGGVAGVGGVSGVGAGGHGGVSPSGGGGGTSGASGAAPFWLTAPGGRFVTRPVRADDGTLHVGSWDGSLYALSERGDVLWSYATGGRIDAPPVVGAFVVVVASWGGAVHAVDRAGAPRWRVGAAAPFDLAPTLGPGAVVYAAADDGTVFAIDEDTGSVAWRTRLPVAPTSSVAVAGDSLFVGGVDGVVYRLDRRGAVLGSTPLGESVVESFAVGPDRIYAGLDQGGLVAMDLAGSVLWQQTISYTVVTPPAIAPDGSLYVGSHNKNLYRFDRDGTERWHVGTDYAVLSAPTVTSGGVYVGASAVLRFDPDGEFERLSDLPAGGSPVVASDGWLYFDLVDGRVAGLGPGERGPSPDPNVATEVAEGLDFPVSMAVMPDGAMLVTQKQGAVRLVRDGRVLPDPVAEFSPHTANESGLIGIDLAADFDETGVFYVVYAPEADLGHQHVVRLRLQGDVAEVLEDPFIVLPSRPTTNRHYGGNLRVGPYGKLFVTLGDLNVASDAADPAKWPGSILRFEPDGSLPTDNPFGAGSPVYAHGLRNPFDLAFSADGTLWAGENGDDVADELHRILPGGDHGWPSIRGHCDHFPLREPCIVNGAVEPAHEFRHVVAPTSVLVYEADLMPTLRGDVLVGGWHSRTVHRFRPLAGGGVAELPPLYVFTGGTPGYYGGGVVDLGVAPDGGVLVLLSGTTIGSIVRIAPP